MLYYIVFYLIDILYRVVYVICLWLAVFPTWKYVNILKNMHLLKRQNCLFFYADGWCFFFITASLNLMSLKQEEILANWVGKINVIQDISFKNKSSYLNCSEFERCLDVFTGKQGKILIWDAVLWRGRLRNDQRNRECCLFRLCASLQAGHVAMRVTETVGRLSRRPDETRR